ncbi:membrane protein insertase YidC [Actinomyces sp. zg-332]|uniref:membrane protein insertase YidC n=1 Tax=Actinomyces sp. zg-332 TaxID=2708340 RepID=UPI001422E587|nr:membrane protein insertase YidC [Actinomyces sp. zg-332]QPK94144.1 membrane protein insertase YidC [Actinomyces sp. zg-332]
MIDFFDTILWPFKIVISWILVGIHDLLLLAGLPKGPGWAWILSIVGLTIVVRILLIPLFFKQIKSSRAMQLLQPEVNKIRKKYKGRTDSISRERMQRETMELYRKHGTSPFSSCMPLLFQLPVFFALYAVLRSSYYGQVVGPITLEYTKEISTSKLFGASLSDTFVSTSDTTVQIISMVLILLMAASQFFTMKQLTMKNMPASALDDENNPALKTNKIMMYTMPVIMAVTGVNFQIGVLIYWLTTNIWSMGQQFYAIERMPAPGSEAEKKLKAKRAAKRAKKGLPPEEIIEEKPRGQRVQPVSKKRQKSGKANQVENKLENETEESETENIQENPNTKLSKEEIARRRYERRAAERKAAAKKRNKKNN